MESVVDGPGCWRVFASCKNPYSDLIKYSPSGLNGQVRTSSWMERQRDILYNSNFEVIKNIVDHFLPSKNRVIRSLTQTVSPPSIFGDIILGLFFTSSQLSPQTWIEFPRLILHAAPNVSPFDYALPCITSIIWIFASHHSSVWEIFGFEYLVEKWLSSV